MKKVKEQHSKVQSNVNTTGSNIAPVYTINKRKITPKNLHALKTKKFGISINGTKLQISESVKTINISSEGIYITF